MERITQNNAGPGDKPFLGRLYSDTRRHEVGSWGWPQQQQGFFLNMQFEAQYRSYGSAFPHATDSIIRLDGVPVGRMMVDRQGATIHLIDIAILEEHRNLGIGGCLIRQLLAECRSGGCVLRLQVLQGNPAIHLYLRLGFVQTGADPVYVQMEYIPTGSQKGPE